MVLLELKGIKKYFPVKQGIFRLPFGSDQGRPQYVKAVDRVDLNIVQGENLGIVGESGSGKTTLARIILKLLSLDEGRIIWNGKDITLFSSRQMRPLRKDLQMVFQDPYSSLDPRFTVSDVIQEAMTFDSKTRKQKRDRVEDLLSLVGLFPRMINRFPHEFSGGERQRIAIARALAMNPKLLILDEAVSSLDVLIQEEILDLLLDLQKRFNLTYLFITHNLRVVKKISSWIAVMYQGKIVELAGTGEIFRNPLHPYTRELLTAAMEYKS